MKNKTLRITALLVCIASLLSFSVGATWSNPFKDVKSSDWYYSSLEWCASRGYINGTSKNTFSPKSATTRAMMIQILYLVCEGEVTKADYAILNKYTDVAKNTWYTDAIVWALNNGIITGTSNTTCSPTKKITRQETVTLLYNLKNRAITYDNSIVLPEDPFGSDTDYSKYPDFNTISNWALPAMKWAIDCNYITGDNSSRLLPKAQCTRAQAVCFIERIMK